MSSSDDESASASSSEEESSSSEEESISDEDSVKVTKGGKKRGVPAAAGRSKKKTTANSTPSAQKKAKTAISAKKAPPQAKAPASKKSPASSSSSERSEPPKASPAKKKAEGGTKGGSGSAKKSAAAAPSKGDAKTIILTYLQDASRPYSVQNIFDNLHKRIPKPTLQSILDALADAGTIIRKEFGKNKIYVAVQEDEDPTSLSHSLQELDGKAGKAKEEKVNLLNRKGLLENQARSLNEQMNDEQLKLAVETLNKEDAERVTKVTKLKDAAGGAKPIDPKEMQELQKELNRLRGFWVKRKRSAMEALNTIAEGGTKGLKQLADEMGVETDEEAGVQKIPELE